MSTARTTRARSRSKPFVVQFASDLHREFEGCSLEALRMPIDPHASLLVLAGDIHNDIGAIDPWIRELTAQLPVVMVAGNHEFYQREFDAQRAALALWAETIPDFHFLDNSAVTLNGVRVIGATFWSDFDRGDPALIAEAGLMMTDYAVITDGSATLGSLQPSRIYQEHLRSAAFIEGELAGRGSRRAIVVTHHAPSHRSTGSKEPRWDKLYGSDYEQLMRNYAPALWVHGHVHESLEYRVADTVVACNPRGYVGYRENARFVATRTVAV
jgi:Icc-related predicted phosphoesterase